MQPVRVARDRWNFELANTGEPITPLGGNMLDDQHPGVGTLFDNFDAEDCRRRLAIMADLGLNCLRQAIGVNHVFKPGEGLQAEGMAHWETFIGLCETYGIYLMPVGGYIGSNDWFDAAQLADSDRALDESCEFWECFAGHFADHPAIWAWDLRNELLYDTQQHMTVGGAETGETVRDMLLADWPAWLEARYATVDAMNRAYAADYETFTDVPASVQFEGKPFDMRAYDVRRYLNERGYLWCKRQCDVLRRVAPNHMICSGNNGWLFPDMDLLLANGFHNIAVHDLFDFVTIHPYPAPLAAESGRGDPLDSAAIMDWWLRAVVAMARIDYYGKPVVMQEFGWYGGGESSFLGKLPYRSEEEHAEYTRRLCQAVEGHVNGFINWPLMDMPEAGDISNHGGMFTADGRRKALAEVYGDMARRYKGTARTRQPGTTVETWSLLGLYTSRPYQDRFWEEVVGRIDPETIPDFRFV
jgi:hypothetical protein